MDRTVVRNKDVNWNEFDPQLYLQQNFLSILPQDEEIIGYISAFYQQHQPHGKYLEIGSGPNIYPILVALPYMDEIEVMDLGDKNIEYLDRQLMQLDQNWQKWIELLRKIDPAYYIDFQSELAAKVKVKQLSLFGLPKNFYDAVSMQSVAESISEDIAEFNEANKCAAESLKPGGLFTATYMIGSKGYDSPGREFPAVAISDDDIKKALNPYLSQLTVKRVLAGGGTIRTGHTGMSVALGIR